MNKQYKVQLNEFELNKLQTILSNGNTSIKNYTRAKVLSLVDESHSSGLSDNEASLKASTSISSVIRIRKKYALGGLDKVFEKVFTPRPSRRKFDGEKEAKLIALCCAKAPKGRASWSIRLLVEEVVKLNILDSVGRETIRQTLKKTKLNLGKS